MGGPIVRNSCSIFVSVESEIRRVKDGTVQLAEGEVSTGTTGLNSLPHCRSPQAGYFSDANTVLYDPLTGQANRDRAGAVCLCQLPWADLDHRSAVRRLQLHSGGPYPPDLEEPCWASSSCRRSRPLRDNYYARDNYESTLHKIDTKVTWTPGNKLNLNNRIELADEPAEQPRHLPVARRRRIQPAQHRPPVASQHHQRLGARDVDYFADIRRRRRLRLHAIPQLGRA